MKSGSKRLAWIAVIAGCAPLAMGARGGCGGPLTSTDPAPDVGGTWGVTYDDTLAVEVTIGGATYDATIPASGGMVHVEHGGVGFDFMLDCSRPEVVCPSEAWPSEVTIEQRDADYPHRMWVTIPKQECSASLRTPAAGECGPDTLNPDCEQVCDGEVTTTEQDTFGLISEEGDRFDLLLGGGAATNGINCVLLGISAAHAGLVNSGSADEGDWTAEQMTDGEVVTAYGGGCLWAGDWSNTDSSTQGLIVGASVTFKTGFTAQRAL